MSSINDVGAGSLGIRARIDNAAWIHSPVFDFLLLISITRPARDDFNLLLRCWFAIEQHAKRCRLSGV